jgi:hypothetical protein
MAPPDRRERVEMSSGAKPKVGPMAVTAMRRAAVIRPCVTWNHAEPLW